MADTVLVHPNRDKSKSKSTKAAVVLLLLVSAALVLLITIGGWSQLQGMHIVSFGYIIAYLVFAYFVWNWTRGLLPVAAGMAILITVVCAVAAPAWFARDKAGFVDPLLPPSLIGLLTLVMIPVQIVLIVFAMRAFQQEWNVEVEVPKEEADRYRDGGDGDEMQGRQPQTA
jgi:lysylphosphatidylglycerol synthetase-like protein (DUF2156 family)